MAVGRGGTACPLATAGRISTNGTHQLCRLLPEPPIPCRGRRGRSARASTGLVATRWELSAGEGSGYSGPPGRTSTRAGAHLAEFRSHMSNETDGSLAHTLLTPVLPPTTRQSRSCHVHTQTSLPSESAKIQKARARSSLTSRPPAARAASTRATASSCGTVRSR